MKYKLNGDFMIKKVIAFLNVFFIIFSIWNVSLCDDEIEEENDEIENIQVSSDTVDEPVINSRIAVAYDRDSQMVIWGKDENKRTAMASTTKIMTAIVVTEKANLDDVVTVSPKAAGTGGSRLGLKKNDKISVRDLLYGLMLRSGNDAAVALAEYVGGSIPEFAEMMNEKANHLGLKETHFVTPHGLDDPEHYTTAFELAKITDYALNNETISKIVGTKYYTISINGYSKSLINTNELLGNVQGLYGVKTGFTGNAGRCLVTSVKRDDMDMIIIVLQADTKKDRSKDSVKIIDYIFSNYSKVNIKEIVSTEFDNWQSINKKRININKAKNNFFNLRITELKNDKIIVKNNEIDKIDIQFNAIFEFEAPVKRDTKIGNIKVSIGEKIVDSIYIYIDENVDKKSVVDYFIQLIKSYRIILQT